MNWRELAVGTVGGALLSLSRPPAGITLEEWMTPYGARQGAWRAAALTVFAAGLLLLRERREGERFPALTLALGALFGFALHGFVLVDVVPIGSQVAWLVALAIAAISMLLLRESQAPAPHVAEQSPKLLRFSLALCGAGFSLVLAALHSRACLLSSGTRDDDTVFGSVALALFATAAIAFGPLLSARAWKRSAFPTGLALAAALAWFSFPFLRALQEPDGYDALLRTFGLHSGLRGTFVYDALIAARVFALPGLCAGIAFTCARSASDLAHVLLGAAVASIFAVHLGDFDATTFEQVALRASERANWGIALAGLGALGATTLVERGTPAWALRSLIPLAICIFGLSNRTVAALPLSPWEKIAPRVEWIRETPEGLLTVEFQTGRGRIVTLDRRRLTPTSEEVPTDDQRLRDSIQASWQIVIVGIVSPERAKVLQDLDARLEQLSPPTPRIGNSSGVTFVLTPWPRLEEELHRALFGGAEPHESLQLDFSRDWKSYSESSKVGVIVALPVEVGSRTLACLERDENDPSDPRRIGWLHASQDIAGLEWGEKVLVTCAHIDDLSIGIQREEADELPAGTPLPTRAWERLARVDIAQRERSARRRVAERLFRADEGPVMDALRRLCAAQQPSSPFETLAQRTEIDQNALEKLRQSGLAALPRGFERELDEFVAATLKGKRDLDGLVAFAAPLADAHPSWPAMQRAAAAADWEFMDWPKAARRLEHVVEGVFDDPTAHLWLI
ncbi:MAG TPA: hypothetical protein VM509_01975, partial [Planctomycetota bacterium]|nr:hypothetical protein [Planctomycetota bacterium]